MKKRSTYLPFGVPDFSEAEIEAVSQVLRSGWVGMGAETLAFEKELAEYIGATHVTAVNSCTSALFLSLHALGIKPGDEVITPSLTWCSTANAVLYLGATPIFCDIDPATMSASPASVQAVLSKRTKAVIHVHYGGLASDMNALRAILPPQVAIVEDAAHALGASYPDGSPVGSSGNLTCFSFYANKNLSTGDGGAVAVNDGDLAEKVRLASHQGLQSNAWQRHTHPTAALTPHIAKLGYKMNYTDLQASIARVQLKRQPIFREKRKTIATRYLQQLKQADIDIRFQYGLGSNAHAHHLFVIRLVLAANTKLNRDELLLALRARNIGAGIHYMPLHTWPIYPPSPDTLSVTKQLMSEIITLPIGVRITEHDVDEVTGHLVELIK